MDEYDEMVPAASYRRKRDDLALRCLPGQKPRDPWSVERPSSPLNLALTLQEAQNMWESFDSDIQDPSMLFDGNRKAIVERVSDRKSTACNHAYTITFALAGGYYSTNHYNEYY
jgi:hypothetical protein